MFTPRSVAALLPRTSGLETLRARFTRAAAYVLASLAGLMCCAAAAQRVDGFDALAAEIGDAVEPDLSEADRRGVLIDKWLQARRLGGVPDTQLLQLYTWLGRGIPVDVDRLTVTWSGVIIPPRTGTYTFSGTELRLSDESPLDPTWRHSQSMQVSIDGAVVFSTLGGASASVPITLQGNERLPIDVIFRYARDSDASSYPLQRCSSGGRGRASSGLSCQKTYCWTGDVVSQAYSAGFRGRWRDSPKRQCDVPKVSISPGSTGRPLAARHSAGVSPKNS